MQTSLAHLWQTHGIQPHAVLGHSQGEIAAAYTAGALTLDDAAKTVALRSRTLTQLAGTGAMASIPLNSTRTTELITGYDDLHIAAYNGPTTTVIAGNPDQLDHLLRAGPQQ
ncbi:acyltransferase domain-containing protein, partial [Spirillospora albida]|uniref:acyltransferase domain-containing protein n=1 Tax=Spirillospora albida TaxID=58123 RepID=UPI001FE1D7BC